jgi:hypothetical protein
MVRAKYVALTLLLVSCVSTPAKPEADMQRVAGSEKDTIQIRLRNETGIDFEQVVVQFPDSAAVDYGAVPNGGVTEYKSAARAYGYAPVVAKAKDRRWSFRPIDYVGEKELTAGRYSYVLRVENDTLTVRSERHD